jgi:uncharacterized protein
VPTALVAKSGEKPALKDMPLPLIVAEGLGVGVLTGLVGVGGGFLIVPALVLLGRVPIRQAVGTSLLVIAMKSGAGFLGYLGQVQIDWRFVAVFTGVATLGILFGSRVAGHIPARALRRGFAVFLMLMGGFILYESRGVLVSGLHAAAAEPAALEIMQGEGR